MSESGSTGCGPGVSETMGRAARLTPTECSVLLLAAHGGLTHRGLAVALGMSKGNVDATLQRIRRKLAVPSKQDLRAFLEARPWLEQALADPDFGMRSDRAERRRLVLLRATIDDLKAVALRARGRADSLAGRHMASDVDDTRRVEELWTLRRVAEIVDASVDEALRLARRPDADSDPEQSVTLAGVGGLVGRDGVA